MTNSELLEKLYKDIRKLGEIDNLVVFSGSCHEVAAFDIWFETEGDCLRAINSLNEQEIEALCWQGEEE